MGGKSKSKQKSSSVQTSSSNPLGPAELTGYFNELNALTSGGASNSGRLFDWAKTGTADVAYDAPTDQQIQALGGLGATRRRDVARARDESLQQIAADPTLSVFQAQRSRQLTDRDAVDNLDAVNQEVEAAILDAMMSRADKTYAAADANAKKKREDLALLAEIFFGGKGQKSTSTGNSTSSGKSSSFNIDSPVKFSF